LTLAAIAGVMNLRGQIVAMIYLRKYLGLDQKFEDA
jgi:chemotaxis signal transduction protein